MAGKFEILKSKNGQFYFYFHLKAGNGETILRSEMYEGKASAEHGVESVKKNAPEESRYERKETKSGGHMFNVKAANHEIIGTSESYTSPEGRDHGIESVKANAPEAAVEDLTSAEHKAEDK